MSTPFKMKGFSGFGNSPLTQKKAKKKAKKKVQTEFDVGGTEMEFADKQGNPIPPAGSSVSGDIQKIFTDRSGEGLTSSDTIYYNMPTGDISYYDPENETKSELYEGYSQKKEEGIIHEGGDWWPIKDKPYLGTKK